MPANLRAFKAAFPHTLPILTGYLFLGAAFGMLLASKGYGPLWTLLMGLFVFAGSLQFVAVGLIATGFQPLQALLLALMVNARHIFYGLSLLATYNKFHKAKPYLIFALTDETFSLLCSLTAPPEVEEERFYLMICLLNQLYWIAGSLLGAFAGTAFRFDSSGIDFVMTALFVVIFLEQWRTQQDHRPALVGLAASLLCLLLFGPDWFIIPAMVLIVIILTLLRKPDEARRAQAGGEVERPC